MGGQTELIIFEETKTKNDVFYKINIKVFLFQQEKLLKPKIVILTSKMNIEFNLYRSLKLKLCKD